MKMHRHHLLEIILWPNEDGTFRKIINTKERLKELGIYDDWKLTITIPANEHVKMHSLNRPDEYGKHLSEALAGKQFTASHKDSLAIAKIGRKWYNNGVIDVLQYECPEGFTRGRLHKSEFSTNSRRNISSKFKQLKWYNNGSINVRAKECPDGYTAGRIKWKNK